ncbi:MAG TPA: DedA family protein [Gemmatimonadales bacterium]|nr:DedA family protein [Gemmatimonadales bacterium]
MLHSVVQWLVETVSALGYPGLTVLMAIESSFIPLPSEVVMPPAGYLAAHGRMDPVLAVLAGTLGSVLGALFNYWFAIVIGEPFLRRYGKYFLVSTEHLDRAEGFFARHGEISTFIGRLVPVVRQLISIPAGMARVPLGRFVAFTALGAGIWCAVLVYIGWLVGRHEATLVEGVVRAYSTRAFLYMVPVLILVVIGYVVWHRRRRSSV